MAAGSVQHRVRPQEAFTGKANEHSHPGTRQLPPTTAKDAPANGSPGAQPDADRRLPNQTTNSPATSGPVVSGHRHPSACPARRNLIGHRLAAVDLPAPGPPARAYRASRRRGPSLHRLPDLTCIWSPPGQMTQPRCRPVRRAVRPGGQMRAARGRAGPLKECRRHSSASPPTARHRRPEPDDLQPPAHATSATPSRAESAIGAPAEPTASLTGSRQTVGQCRQAHKYAKTPRPLFGMSGKPASRPTKSSTHTGPGRAAEWVRRSGRRELSDLVPASLSDGQAGQGAWRPQRHASAPARKVTEALLLRVKIPALAP